MNLDLNFFNIIVFSFLIGVFASTLAAGPVTLLVFRNAFLGNYMKSVSLVFGAAIMESVYCFLALTIIDSFFFNELFQITFRLLSVVILFFVGVYLFKTSLPEGRKIITSKDSSSSFVQSFFVGFTLVMLNPTIILTWSAASIVLISFKIIELNLIAEIIFFTIFSLIGSVFGGLFLVFLIKKYKNFLSNSIITYLFKFIGVIVMIVSIYFVFDFVLLYVF